MLGQAVSLNSLWQSVSAAEQVFEPKQVAHLPNAARRYLEHAIAPGTPLASTVRLRMQGEIKLKNWQPFQAEQVISWPRGMIWQATAWMNGLPIRGWDRLVNGEGAMQWKLLGLFPVLNARGPDITRSAIGRMQGECVWLPSVFCGADWTTSGPSQAQAHLSLLGETTEITLKINQLGGLQSICLKRWGNPEGEAARYTNFGGLVEAEGTFLGYTIPTCVRIGWYFDGERFESDGEFFRATIDEAIYY